MDFPEYQKEFDLRERKLLAAENQNTDPQLLDELIYDDDFDVQLAVVGNPSTSIQTLQQFADSGNRRWWLAYSNPKFEYTNCDVLIPIDEKMVLAQSDAASGELLTFLAFDERFSDETEIFLRRNPNLPDDVANALGFRRKNWKRFSRCKMENEPILEDYEHFSKMIDAILPYSTPTNSRLFSCREEMYEKERARVQDLKLSPYSLSLLSRSSFHQTLRRVARNVRTPQNTLIYLALRDVGAETSCVAENTSCPPLLLDLLSRKEFLTSIGVDERTENNVFEALAENVRTPANRLLSLAKSESPKVRAKAGSNPRIPFEALCMLTFDREYDVRKACWKNLIFSEELANLAVRHDGVDVLSYISSDARSSVLADIDEQSVDSMSSSDQMTLAKLEESPKWLLARLASNPDHRVRQEVASNTATPQDALNTLALDREDCVRRALLFNKSADTSILDQLRWDDVVRGAQQASTHPNLSNSMRWRLARNDNPIIRGHVARSPYTPLEILEFLAADEDEGVQYGVYINPNASEEACSRIIQGRDGLLKNHMISSREKSIRSKMVRSAANRNTPISVLKQMLNYDDRSVRCALATNRSLDDDCYHQLAKDDDEFVRFCVAKNPMIPQDAMKLFAADESKFVRIALAQNPKAGISVLDSLSNDEDPEVRKFAYGNPASPMIEMTDGIEVLPIVLRIMREKGQNKAARTLDYLQELSRRGTLPRLARQ